MGYGGSLIWSGVAKNLKLNNPDRKIIFVYSKSFKEYFSSRKRFDQVIYDNNNDIFLIVDRFSWLFNLPRLWT